MISFNKRKALDSKISCYAVTSKQKFTHLVRIAHMAWAIDKLTAIFFFTSECLL